MLFWGLWGSQTLWRAADRLPALPDDETALDGLENKAIAASLDLALRREAEIAREARSRDRQPVRVAGGRWEVGAAAERRWKAAGLARALPVLACPLLTRAGQQSACSRSHYRNGAEHFALAGGEIRSRVRAARACCRLTSASRCRGSFLPLNSVSWTGLQLQNHNAMRVSAFPGFSRRPSGPQISGAEYVAGTG